MKTESVLGIAVPEAEPLVKALRDQFDSSAALGVPAHITLLYPFMPPHLLTTEALAELREFFAQIPAFEFSLTELERFPQILYLAPSPAEPFKALTQAIVARYPAYLPYGGAFAEVIPHLTIADAATGAQLDNVESEFMRQHGAQLPVRVKVNEVVLWDNASGRWEVRQTFGLSARS